jgi:hypothetical protein
VVDVACIIIGAESCSAGVSGLRGVSSRWRKGRQGKRRAHLGFRLDDPRLALFNDTRPCCCESRRRLVWFHASQTYTSSLPSGQAHAGRLPF